MLPSQTTALGSRAIIPPSAGRRHAEMAMRKRP
jgi:hypothetical protein